MFVLAVNTLWENYGMLREVNIKHTVNIDPIK